MIRLHSAALLLLLALAPAAAAQSTAAPPPAETAPPAGLRFGVPTNYFGRFGGVSPILELNDKNDVSRIGLGGLPLPTEHDLRFTVANRPDKDVWDYSISTRMNNTTYLIGIENDVRRAEVTHNPYTGPQFTGVLREKGLSELSAGYAFTALEGQAYVYNKAGVAASGEKREPFTYSQVGTAYTEKVGNIDFRVAPLARLYTYPFAGKVHSNAELTVTATTAPTPQLLLEATHLERFAAGDSVISEYGLGRAQETSLYATYRLPYAGDPAFGVGAVRGSYTHNWQNDWNYYRGDLFLRSNLLPVMVGPRAEYRVAPDGTAQWIYGFVTLGK
ncbi:hypothetical protein GCM10017783_14100 [Deinococcus piscis]|uniref:Uncharacterized protein n=1 Tax=Deinococcus piscis TaxID=394230 RepID=A0ABQ3K5D4_9DEIO|nr:hypothetical protein [Deinococcus piscis]GHG02941.1 hypothetical protein GCM10017783_14100 [Deinococcus piscis]